ncbi:ComEA family DNA-binding protein [Cellulomonas hominis]
MAARDVADLAERWRRRQLVAAVPGRAAEEIEPPARRPRPGRSRWRWAVGIRLAWAAVSVVGLLVGAVALRAVAVSDAAVPVALPTIAAGATGVMSPVPGTGADGVLPATDPARGPLPTVDPAAARGPTVIVHVVGQVAQPGVVELPAGARVADAVAAAGGAGPEADLAVLNLARLLVDGEQVVVPRPGEEIPIGEVAGAAGGAWVGAAAGAGGGAGGSGAGAGGDGRGGSVSGAGLADRSASLLDLNSADRTALDALPGIGPVLAERIVAWRAEHGRFASVDELEQVPGIGPAVLSRLRDLVRV